MVPENIHTPPTWMVNGNSKGEGGANRQKFPRGLGGCPHEEFDFRVRKVTEKSKESHKVNLYLRTINTHV